MGKKLRKLYILVSGFTKELTRSEGVKFSGIPTTRKIANFPFCTTGFRIYEESQLKSFDNVQPQIAFENSI